MPRTAVEPAAFKPDVRAVSRSTDGTCGFQRGRRFLRLSPGLFNAVRTGGPGVLGAEALAVFTRAGFVARADASTSGNSRTDVFLDVMCDGETDAVLAALQSRPFFVIGCGGLGSQIAVMLAALGAQRLTLVDRDTIEASNLNRLFWASPADVGLAKVDVLAEHLRTHYSIAARTMNTVELARKLNGRTARAEFVGAWVFFALDSSTDERALVRQLHRVHGIGYLRAGYCGAECLVGPAVIAGNDPCPFCASTPLDISSSSTIFPSALPNNATTAGFAVTQAVRLLQGRRSSVHKHVWALDLLTGRSSRRRIAKGPRCPVCRPVNLS
jgi:molybdopterin/thiamine biosynthesis adenylyltransferase